ncbi:hypothetical protein C1M59_18550 [Vibrio diazotrophicus]|nr:hypothetical protein C1M59_18550 [Vibrio diazotrophicus]
MKFGRILNLLLVLFACWSSFAMAFDVATCSALKSNNNFSIKYSISEAKLREVIYVEKGVGNAKASASPIALWTNSQLISSPVIRDKVTEKDKSYNIWLTYDTADTANKQGILYYYLLQDGSWQLIASALADLRDLDSVNIDIIGSQVSNLECDSALTLPPLPEVSTPLEVCDYFPQPVQGWITKDTNYSVYDDYLSSELNLSDVTASISGWSDNYLADSQNIYTYTQDWQNGQSWQNLRVGFDTTTNTWISYKNPDASSCQGIGCYPGDDDGYLSQRKAATPEPLNVTFDASTSLEFSPDNYRNLCDGDVCDYDDSGSQILITIKRDLNSLSVNAYTGKPIVFKFYGGRKVTKLTLSDNSGLYLPESANVYFGQIIVDGNGNTTLSFESGVRLNIVGDGTDATGVESADFRMGNPIMFSHIGAGSDYVIPTFYGPSASMHLKSKKEIKAFIIAKQAFFDVDVSIEGSVTANYLWVNSGIRVSRTTVSKDCWQPGGPKDDYTLVLSPTSDIALVCESLSPTLTVMSNGAVATDFNGTATVNVNGVETSVSITNGTATIDLSSNGESQTVSVNASLDGYSDVNSVSGSYQFVPFKFAVDDQYVIANKQQLTMVSALACSSGEQVDVGYNGQPTVSSSWQQPSNGSGELSFSPVLQGGISTEASRGLKLEDSGEMVVTLTDESFDCSDLDDCPIEGNGKLTGQFTVYSRPWTFAICSTSDTNLDSATGNSDGGNGFIPAGETFSAQVIPLKYQSNLTGEVATDSDWCRPSNITTNFFLAHSFGNKIKLSSEVASPTNANSTALLASDDDLSIDRVNNGQEYLFTNLYWDEVGSLKVMAATESYDATCSSVSGLQAWYECTQRGYREIGRFYPAYFEITQSDWSVSEQKNISYLSQPYDLAEFKVFSRTSKGSSVRNYDKFAGGLRATLNILQDEDIGSDRLALSVSDDNNWQYDTSSSESNWHLADLSAVFYRDVTLNSSGKHVSEVDGPFNVPTEDLIGDELSTSTRFGFVVQGGVDPVETRGQVLTSCLNESSEFNAEGELSSCNLLFPTQPPSRYGRMKLFDVGGTSTISSIRVPLQIEYWNGTQFVVNTDDSNSVFSTDGNKTCQQVLWRELIDGAAIVQEASLAGAAGEKTVSEGASSLVTAEPATTDVGYIRQQVRFWLRLDNDNTVSQQGCSSASVSKAQPWLRYNWWKNQDGSINEDEDPSAVVTFGIHRGNDRIIFRGESNLTGQ